MAEQEKPAVGTVGWVDLTVENADALRDFYQAVAGWSTQTHNMGEYSDFVMMAGERLSRECATSGG